EVVFPVEDKKQIKYLRDKVLENYLKDNLRARILQADGSYIRAKPESEDKSFDVQSHLMGN
ncbi:MAG: hypothetical protein JNM46_01815, partial [Anaerolineales bacterium]|nr:hypothetical protein [Anaerolineales bacterium]